MMAKKTIYCVQTYSGGKREFIKGPLRQFKTPDEATAMGAELSRRVPGVIVFSVSGEPDFDCWDEPAVLAVHGRVPREATG